MAFGERTMNTADHHKIVTLAVSGLPASSRSFWEPLCPQIEATCMVPDEVAIPLLNGEDGPWRRYFPSDAPKHSFEKRGASARAHFFDVRFYVEHVLAALRREEVPEACAFLGVLSHSLGDFAEPAHYCEREVTLLLPPPPERANCNSHRMIEDTPTTLDRHSYVAGALGDTVDTIVLRLEGRLRELYERAMATALPMLSALYVGDTAAASRLSDRVLAETVEVMGDVLHSCWCVYRGSWTEEEREAMSVCRLDRMEPAAYDVEFNYGCRPIRGAITLDQRGAAIPLQLSIQQDGVTTVRAVDGLCVVPHALPIKGTRPLAAVEFDLPPKAFSRFTSVVGLLAGFSPQATCRFVVEGDGRALLESPPVRAGDAALEVDVELSGIRRLRMVVHTDGSTDKLAFPIWGRPTVRNEAAKPAAPGDA